MKRFGVAYGIAKIYEVLGWIVMAGGFIASIALVGRFGVLAMIGGMVGSIAFGLGIVFNAQLVLVLLSTENNTYNQLQELTQTNRMLQDTLGRMTVNLQKMADAETKR